MAEAAAAEQAREEAAAGAEEAVKIICLGDSAVGKSKCVAAPVPAARPGLAGGEGAAASPCAVLFPQAAGEVPARRIVSTRRSGPSIPTRAAGAAPQPAGRWGGAGQGGGRRVRPGELRRPCAGGRCAVRGRAPPSAP